MEGVGTLCVAAGITAPGLGAGRYRLWTLVSTQHQWEALEECRPEPDRNLRGGPITERVERAWRGESSNSGGEVFPQCQLWAAELKVRTLLHAG